MADKEERIRVEIIPVCKRPKNKDQYKCDCIGSPNEMAGLQVCPIHPQVVAKQGISKQEAIEKMAKAICMQDNLLESCVQCLTQCDKEKQKNMCEHILKKRKYNIEPSYFDRAEAALNALLER